MLNMSQQHAPAADALEAQVLQSVRLIETRLEQHGVGLPFVGDNATATEAPNGNNHHSLSSEPKNVKNKAMSLEDKVVVFTGRLQHMTRAQATRLAEAAGATVRTNVSAHTDVLVVGENAGAKLDKAPADAEQLTEAEFLELVGEPDADPEPEEPEKKQKAKKTKSSRSKASKKSKKKTKKASKEDEADYRGYKVHLELIDPAKNANKYYILEVQGKSLYRHYGRYGSQGQTMTVPFGSVAEARKEFERLFKEKTRKGYVHAPEGKPLMDESTTQKQNKNKKSTGTRKAASRKSAGRKPRAEMTAEEKAADEKQAAEDNEAGWSDSEALLRMIVRAQEQNDAKGKGKTSKKITTTKR